jgi:mRNA deadenylase 3'-5' endonuclease subunit Ccr4
VAYAARVFRLVSWNVLADAYVQPSYYPAVDPALLARGARTAAIVAQLAASGADVACLQEAEPTLVDALRAAGGWDVHYASKRGRPDGLAVLARGAVRVADVRTLVFADGAPDRDDSGHIALCATLIDGALRCELATTHLRWDPPGTPSAQRWATRQARHLIERLGALDRAIVCGDLNVEPADEAYQMLLAAGLHDPMVAVLHPTANPNGRARRIDHILCGRALVGQPLPILAIDDATPLPSQTMPSDHLPIEIGISIGAQS